MGEELFVAIVVVLVLAATATCLSLRLCRRLRCRAFRHIFLRLVVVVVVVVLRLVLLLAFSRNGSSGGRISIPFARRVADVVIIMPGPSTPCLGLLLLQSSSYYVLS
eukprot:TRINITY_DN7528_c1_g1_i10.p1 TRINITY_DN7528_c1_g1~~TRINITY_DN7528_c1_g1_i10.p1  ORF type:complete len:107 (+),score=10.69 TRINITY_DN7528_c1_g1_i10:281-601(+)